MVETSSCRFDLFKKETLHQLPSQLVYNVFDQMSLGIERVYESINRGLVCQHLKGIIAVTDDEQAQQGEQEF